MSRTCGFGGSSLSVWVTGNTGLYENWIQLTVNERWHKEDFLYAALKEVTLARVASIDEEVQRLQEPTRNKRKIQAKTSQTVPEQISGLQREQSTLRANLKAWRGEAPSISAVWAPTQEKRPKDLQTLFNDIAELVDGDRLIVSLSAGFQVQPHAILGFGADDETQLGRGKDRPADTISHEFSVSPQAIPALYRQRVVSLSCGSAHSVALTAAGDAFAWGSARQGRLGLPLPPHTARVAVPSLVLLPDHFVTAAACGDQFTLLLAHPRAGAGAGAGAEAEAEAEDPSLGAAGSDAGDGDGDDAAAAAASVHQNRSVVFSFGAKGPWLGQGTTTRHIVAPCPVSALAGMGVSTIAAGQSHAAAITADGALYTWGASHGVGGVGMGGRLGHVKVGTDRRDKHNHFKRGELNLYHALPRASKLGRDVRTQYTCSPEHWYQERQYGDLVAVVLPLETGTGRHRVCRCTSNSVCDGRVRERDFVGPVLGSFQIQAQFVNGQVSISDAITGESAEEIVERYWRCKVPGPRAARDVLADMQQRTSRGRVLRAQLLNRDSLSPDHPRQGAFYSALSADAAAAAAAAVAAAAGGTAAAAAATAGGESKGGGGSRRGSGSGRRRGSTDGGSTRMFTAGSGSPKQSFHSAASIGVQRRGSISSQLGMEQEERGRCRSYDTDPTCIEHTGSGNDKVTTAKSKMEDYLKEMVQTKEPFNLHFQFFSHQPVVKFVVPDRTSHARPRRVTMFVGKKVRLVACGDTHTVCAVEETHYGFGLRRGAATTTRVYSFGEGLTGALGHGPSATQQFTSEPIPRAITALDGLEVKKLCCGRDHSVLLDAGGEVRAFGDNSFGAVGTAPAAAAGSGSGSGSGGQEAVSEPSWLRLSGITDISCGGEHTLCCDKQGRVFSFGRASAGRLGIPPSARRPCVTQPKLVRSLSSQFVTAVAAGGSGEFQGHSLVLSAMYGGDGDGDGSAHAGGAAQPAAATACAVQ